MVIKAPKLEIVINDVIQDIINGSKWLKKGNVINGNK